MNKILLRYLIYFGIFICFVQIMESAPLQDAFAKVGLKTNFESLGTYAPLFLSALLIDITYRIGKRQNQIAKQQNEIAEQQRRLQEYQYKLDKYQHYEGLYKNLIELQRRLVEFRLLVNSSMCHLYFYSGRDVLEHAINEMRILEKRIVDCEASFTLKLPNEAFGFEDILTIFNHCELIVDRIGGYKMSMQKIDNCSVEQVKLWYGPILSSIAHNNPKINMGEVYALQGNAATFIEAVKVTIQKHISAISEKYPPYPDSVDMLAEIIELLGYDKANIIKWYSEIDRLTDKIYVQSDILKRIQRECAIDINN